MFRVKIIVGIIAVVAVAGFFADALAQAESENAQLSASSEIDKNIGPAPIDSTTNSADKKSTPARSKGKQRDRGSSDKSRTELGSGSGNTGGVSVPSGGEAAIDPRSG